MATHQEIKETPLLLARGVARLTSRRLDVGKLVTANDLLIARPHDDWPQIADLIERAAQEQGAEIIGAIRADPGLSAVALGLLEVLLPAEWRRRAEAETNV
jgi:hypothetical protein